MPRRDHPRHDAALHYVAAEPSLHRRRPRKAASRVGWTEEGRRHRGTQHLGPAAMVETGRVAASRAARLTANRHGGLSHGSREFEVSRQGLVDVRFCALNGLKSDIAPCPFCAKLRHWMWRRLKEKAARRRLLPQ